MFYQKTIAALKSDVAYYKEQKDKFVDLYYGRAEAIIAGKQELEKVQQDVSNLRSENAVLAVDFAAARTSNVDLELRNRDLEYQNQLLVTVLQTLRIPVKLPARKK